MARSNAHSGLMQRPLVLAVCLVAACSNPAAIDAHDLGAPDLLGPRVPGVPVTFQVTIEPDGSFSPATIELLEGDSIEWIFADAHDAVVPTSSAACDAIAPFDPTTLTGPLPEATAGIFALGPLDGDQRATDAAWSSEHSDGFFIRLLWNQVQPTATTWDFSVIDREVDRAIANGKLYSLGVKAGSDGTPAWIFANGVTPLQFQDRGGGGEDDGETGCGKMMKLGNPTEAAYQTLYFAMLQKLADHLRERADRYRALAYIKLSGANLFSHENRLPKRCDPGCVCNPRVWADAGYRPSGLYAFYAKQAALLTTAFPGKTMSYALIQDGFPAVSEAGDYETEDGSSSGGPLPKGVEQTEQILKTGGDTYDLSFAVQHNGLGMKPPRGAELDPCPNEGKHPAVGPYANAGSGCPNRWVLQAGAIGQVTGFQTNNLQKVMNLADLESTLQNQLDNSDGIFLEIYEPLLVSADAGGGVLDSTASGRTLAAWSDVLHTRRATMFPELAPSQPMKHTHTFHRTETGSADEIVRYVHPTKCKTASDAIGTVIIKQP